MVTKQQFSIGAKVEFVYHDKTRKGVVETVADDFVRLELEPGTDNPTVKFKSFNYDKIQVVNGISVIVE